MTDIKNQRLLDGPRSILSDAFLDGFETDPKQGVLLTATFFNKPNYRGLCLDKDHKFMKLVKKLYNKYPLTDELFCSIKNTDNILLGCGMTKYINKPEYYDQKDGDVCDLLIEIFINRERAKQKITYLKVVSLPKLMDAQINLNLV
tara:strand:- start:52 stop:489 length:438 start_codon:yes stop_codon:yes gene_type:complete